MDYLDDASHSSAARADRDAFVDVVLRGCGYRVLPVYGFDKSELRRLVSVSAPAESVQLGKNSGSN